MERETEVVVEKLCAMYPLLREALENVSVRHSILVFSDFGTILAREAVAQTSAPPSTIFAYLEECYISGTLEVRSAIATCLYESLLNEAYKAPEQMRPMMRLLGPKSRETCLELNAMHGIKMIPW